MASVASDGLTPALGSWDEFIYDYTARSVQCRNELAKKIDMVVVDAKAVAVAAAAAAGSLASTRR